MEWSPKSLTLLICTGTGRFFLWSAGGASVCEVPLESKDFKVSKIKWSSDGASIVIHDKNRFMIALPKFEFADQNDEAYY